MAVLIIYVLICVAIAAWGEKVDGSFWQTLVISLLLSPIAGIVVVICSAAAKSDINWRYK